MLTPVLKEFIDPVPVCIRTASLATAMEVFRQGNWERLVVVDEQQHPLGLLHLRSLIPYLLPDPVSGAPNHDVTGMLDWQRSLLDLIDLNVPIIGPLARLPASLSLDQLGSYLQEQPDRLDWALVDSNEAFVGLLDSSRLLRFLMTRSTSEFGGAVAENWEPLPLEPADRPAIASSEQSRLTIFQPLVQLLEQLPLPLMLQTQAGQVVARNSVWSRQVGELLDPARIRLDAAALLEATSPQQQSSSRNSEGQSNFAASSQENQHLREVKPLQPTESHSPPQPPYSPTYPAAPQGLAQLKAEIEQSQRQRMQLQQTSYEVNPLNQQPQDQKGELQVQAKLQQQLIKHLSQHSRELEPHQTHWTTDTATAAGHNSLPLDKNQLQPLDHQTPTTQEPATQTSASPSLCHLGSEPNTCICVCQMRDGQEKSWQFTRILLGVTPSSLGLNLPKQPPRLELVQAASPSIPELAVHNFRLATLGITPESTLSLSDVPDDLAAPLPQVNPAEPLWLVLAQDMTEQQQVAKELAAKNADLVQLNRLKDEFLACISHELKTPLTAVLGLSSLLKDQSIGALNQRQARYARLIHQSGRHLVTMVNDILDLTRMETGQLELILEPVNLGVICDRAFEQAQQLQPEAARPETAGTTQILDATIPFQLEIEPGLESIVADELRLRQMLANLLSNAIKFTEPGNEFGLKVSRWEGWIAFLVWDTGIGIPAEQQHLIFQKFQQLENPLTRRFEGRGLGLVLTQRLARLHGGDITFVSKEGQGSQFTLLLPPSPPQPTTIGTLPAMAPQPHATEPGVPGNRLVLIVEAGPQLIEDLAEQLTGLGYRVAIARSGTEALEKARRLQPCTIFLNPLLPLLSGWDVLTLLKSDAETQHIPVVVTATSAEKAQADQNRADGFLSLPVKHRALQQSLARLNTQFSPTQEEHRPLSRLTILRLSPGPERVAETGVLNAFSPQQSALDLDLSSLLHLHHYRIVEADDLDQAELLARVWKPDVVLLDGAGLTKPYPYLQQLGQCAFLASLPLVTLNQATTQAANQIGLSVFPCLAPLGTTPTVEQPEIAVLLQVIQVAAGFAWKPCILVVEAATIPSDAMEEEIMPPGLSSQEISRRQVQPADGLGPQDAPSPGITQKGAEWLQAFIQYIQKAGFRGLSARSWTEVLQQIQHQSVDLLLIRLGGTKPDLAVVKALVAIQQVEVKPPILVLDHRWQWDEVPATSIQGKVDPLEPLLQAIASQILPASLSMKELLDQIHQALAATR